MIYLGRITADVGTAAFDHQYWEIVSGKSSVSKTSWALLIDEMMRTDKWANYSPRYRADLEEVFGENLFGLHEMKSRMPSAQYEALLSTIQNRNGSWPGNKGESFNTAGALLSLALNYRFLPIYEK